MAMASPLFSQPLSFSSTRLLSSSKIFPTRSLLSSSLPHKSSKLSPPSLVAELPLESAQTSSSIAAKNDEDAFSVKTESWFLANNVDKHEGLPLSNYIYNGIKMTLLIGMLTLQGSQQAIADTGFAGRMQSLDFFGDPGDISTGFASVRKASL